MNQQKLEKNRKRSTLQIPLLVLFTFMLATPGLGQGVREQSESLFMSDESQAQVQQAKDKDRRNKRRLDVAAHVKFTLDNSNESGQVEETNTALSNVFLPSRAKDSLLKADESLSSPQSDPDLSNFAFFIEAGAAFPHGDISFFLDPGFSLNAGLEYMITNQFSAEGTFGYHRFSVFFGGDTSVYQLSGNGKFYFVDDSTKLRPFVNGGVGLYVTDSATTHFGGNIGVGILYEVTPKFGIKGSYNFNVFTAGATSRFSTVQGGVRFRF